MFLNINSQLLLVPRPQKCNSQFRIELFGEAFDSFYKTFKSCWLLNNDFKNFRFQVFGRPLVQTTFSMKARSKSPNHYIHIYRTESVFECRWKRPFHITEARTFTMRIGTCLHSALKHTLHLLMTVFMPSFLNFRFIYVLKRIAFTSETRSIIFKLPYVK